MNLEDQFGLEHLLFEQRKCKICGEMKELINDFYKTRKDRGNVPSAYAYECKRCSIKRVSQGRKKKEKIEETCRLHRHMRVKDVRLKEFLRGEEKGKR